jgi:DNA replication and repair protein RecF
MLCTQLQVYQFKNLKKNTYQFTGKATAIVGANGVGKTNMLDAIYFAAYTKSWLTKTDSLLTQFGQQGLMVQTNWLKKDTEQKVKIILRENGKKEVYFNEVLQQPLYKFIGNLGAVHIAPDDIAIINEGSEYRRKWLDGLLCQTDGVYLENYILYNKILLQRNACLKQIAEQRQSHQVLAALNSQIENPAMYLWEKRIQFCNQWLPQVHKQYNLISKAADELTTNYDHNQPKDSFLFALKNNEMQDVAAGRTLIGPHKDDIQFNVNNLLARQYASQGQKKTALFALKLVELNYLAQTQGHYPILLMDDVFEKLDNDRLHNLFSLLPLNEEFQFFITDTGTERVKELFKTLKLPIQIIPID